jgi:hypothetical protein
MHTKFWSKYSVEEITWPCRRWEENLTRVRETGCKDLGWIKFCHYRIQLFCKYNLFSGKPSASESRKCCLHKYNVGN